MFGSIVDLCPMPMALPLLRIKGFNTMKERPFCPISIGRREWIKTEVGFIHCMP